MTALDVSKITRKELNSLIKIFPWSMELQAKCGRLLNVAVTWLNADHSVVKISKIPKFTRNSVITNLFIYINWIIFFIFIIIFNNIILIIIFIKFISFITLGLFNLSIANNENVFKEL